MNTFIDLRETVDRPHHPNMSPSSIAAVLQCACYYGSGKDSPDSNKGTVMHDYTMDLIMGKPAKVKVGDEILEDAGTIAESENFDTTFSMADSDDCKWACEEIKNLFAENDPDAEVRIEEKLQIVDGRKKVISFGYCDFNSYRVIIDLKSGLDYRPDMHYYEPQLKTYSLANFQRKPELEQILCVEVYIKPRRVRKYFVTRTQCEVVVAAAIQRRRSLEKYPALNDYCHFCGRIVWCPAVNKIAWRTVELYVKANGQEEMFAVPEKISCPEIMAQALTIVKKVLEPLTKEIKERAIEFTEDKEIPYYKRSKTSPRKKIVDVRAAFNLLPLDNKEFCRALSLSLTDLSEVYSEKYGCQVKDARHVVEGLLENLIVCGEAKPKLEPLLKNQLRKRKAA